MSFVLALLLSAALAVIGILLHMGESLGDSLSGIVTGLTLKMGPGVVHRPSKASRLPWVFYALAFAALCLAIWELFTR